MQAVLLQKMLYHEFSVWLDSHTLRHEIGYLLSLHHPHEYNPACYDDTVMHYNAELQKDYVTEHDKRALKKQWGL